MHPVTAATFQGQPLWQVNDKDAGRRAPADDESGHTWQHSDEALFHMTKYGRFDATPAEAVSFMPAFKEILTDADILSVIAFIKRRWPLGLRVSQAMLNPGQAGMAADASHVAWKLPPTCMATLAQDMASLETIINDTRDLAFAQARLVHPVWLLHCGERRAGV